MTSENVLRLAPWFQEFQMEDHLHACDIVSSTDVFSKTLIGVTGISYNRRTFWKAENATEEGTRRNVETAENILEYLTISDQLSLKKTLTKALLEITYLMKDGYDLLLESHELMKKTINVFQNYRDHIQSHPSFRGEVEAFYIGISDGGNVDWDSEIFCSLMRSKLEILVTKRQMEAKDKEIMNMDNEIKRKNIQMSRLNEKLLARCSSYRVIYQEDDLFDDESYPSDDDLFDDESYPSDAAILY